MDNQVRFQEGKTLVFNVGNSEYGIHINQVVSIERMKNMTSYPNRAPHVLGVTTIRDVVTPVVDVRGALTGEILDPTDTTRIIIVQANDSSIGIVVDAAREVIEIEQGNIQQPQLLGKANGLYLKGVAKLDDRLIILLDIEKLLEDTTNLDELREIVHSIAENMERVESK